MHAAMRGQGIMSTTGARCQCPRCGGRQPPGESRPLLCYTLMPSRGSARIPGCGNRCCAGKSVATGLQCRLLHLRIQSPGRCRCVTATWIWRWLCCRYQCCSKGGLSAAPPVQVAAPVGETFCVLQMPRGNLEVVSPRALVLAAIADALLVITCAQSRQLYRLGAHDSASAKPPTCILIPCRDCL